MEWWPFDDEGSVGRGSIGSLSYYWVPVTTRLFQGQGFILIRDIASVSCECNGAGWSTCTCALKECGTKGWCMKNQVGVAGRLGFFVSVCKPGLWVGVKTKQEKKKRRKTSLASQTLCSSMLTVIHCGLPHGHWGWVGTQSELYITLICLIYSSNNNQLIKKKRKGRQGE